MSAITIVTPASSSGSCGVRQIDDRGQSAIGRHREPQANRPAAHWQDGHAPGAFHVPATRQETHNADYGRALHFPPRSSSVPELRVLVVAKSADLLVNFTKAAV
jgi:hypothetical protein